MTVEALVSDLFLSVGGKVENAISSVFPAQPATEI